MSLDFNYKNVADQSYIHDGREWNARFTAIIHVMVALGVQDLCTDSQIFKAAVRFELYQDVFGPLMERIAEGEPVPERITIDDLYRLKGLKTNISSTSWATFFRMIRNKIEIRVKHQLKEGRDET